ncbi:response regulator transcription factor [Desulfoscipio gibsoniae]|uniref:Stage 0 sporulation protein A homolog n=1 Tax=Desulfoscipio gibsoniae DSM 7213 TaxID=767817 RepID=R4KCI2_9FIRM|nr:response regulator transcription factor [Desulfoscipio gibsoniae]AGL00284.1 response regulator with CheY-like receiver domain and winged-helix DNA-binding domain [Desulfoscipio gibsoniae DSM 7213]
MEKLNVLVCDDDTAIVDALEIYLKQEDYGVVKAYTGIQALKALSEQKIHLVLLDIMMPELDGLLTTIKIREELNVPIIILSAKSEDTDKITGLNFGADDYVTKPFNPLELMARVKSQMRRYTALGSLATNSSILKTGSLELDPEARELRVDGEDIKLTATEFGIMLFLMRNMGRVFSTEQIYEHVWNEPSYSAENTVPVHIRRIREKTEINPKEPKYLKVVWGIGYKIEKY